jgi:hypothetical protein
MPCQLLCRVLSALFLIATFLLLAGAEADARLRKQPYLPAEQKAVDNAKKNLQKLNESQILENAYVLLNAAEYTYGGRRTKAVNEVRSAINQLNSQQLKNPALEQNIKSLRAKHASIAKSLNWESRTFYDKDNLSDFQLYQALLILSDVRISANDSKQTQVTKSLDLAIKEINTSLTTEAQKRQQKSLKGQEALALREAHILLAAADSDFPGSGTYHGHRKDAMEQLRKAVELLEAKKSGLLDGETAEAEIKLMRESAAAYVKSVPKGEKKQAARYFNDAQIYDAYAITKNVMRTLGANEQHPAYRHVANAAEELEKALKIR